MEVAKTVQLTRIQMRQARSVSPKPVRCLNSFKLLEHVRIALNSSTKMSLLMAAFQMIVIQQNISKKLDFVKNVKIFSTRMKRGKHVCKILALNFRSF